MVNNILSILLTMLHQLKILKNHKKVFVAINHTKKVRYREKIQTLISEILKDY